jgi:hypothetical protein
MTGDFDTIEQYLEHVGRQRRSDFARRFRRQFQDTRGTAELAMLAAPSEKEYADFQQAVAQMTERQKAHPKTLTDEQIRDIAQRARADPGNVGIFLNGYILARRPDSGKRKNHQ